MLICDVAVNLFYASLIKATEYQWHLIEIVFHTLRYSRGPHVCLTHLKGNSHVSINILASNRF